VGLIAVEFLMRQKRVCFNRFLGCHIQVVNRKNKFMEYQPPSRMVVCLAAFTVCHPLAGSGEDGFLVNGRFTDGLAGWEVNGAVFVSAGSAVLMDEAVQRSLLFQGVALEAGNYRFGFDFRNLLSSAEPLGFARDSLFASLFVSSTPLEFDPVSFAGFQVSIPLFDLDALSMSLWTGAVAPSPFGGGFTRFETVFSLGNPATVFAVFDFFDLNGINADSLVLIDNVTLVPEPGLSGLAVAFCALAFAVYFRRRKP